MTKLKQDRSLDTTPIFGAYEYQAEAFNTVKDLEFSAVFHEQGLGKTKIALDTALYWIENEIVDSVIIVTKRSLVENWANEIDTHTNIKPILLTQNRNQNFYALNSPATIYICHYEVVSSELDRMKLFSESRDLGMVLDESQKIKNPDTKVAQAFHLISGYLKKKIIMSGTPISNRPYDIWSQIYFLDKGASLGEDFQDFKESLDLTGELRDDEAKRDSFEEKLGAIWNNIRSFSVRETKDGAGISLPRKNILMVKTGWEDQQECLYRKVRDEMRITIVQDGLPVEDNSEDILKRLLRLIQICSNPATIDDTYSGPPGKYNYLISLLSKITSNNEKAIVWTSFIKNAEWLKRHLLEYSPVMVHGGLTMELRNKNITQFKTNPAIKLLIATPGAAKEGLTLTVANHVIFFDRSFSLDDYLQAQDRIHRISQEKECFVYNLIMENSIDEWVNVLINAKHLAAQFGQGDISAEEYGRQSDYSFQEILSQILSNGEG
jgi:SNF2 family DNA or RNA helicase